MRSEDSIIEGRNAVIEALRSDREVERVFIQKSSKEGPLSTIYREVKKQSIRFDFVDRKRLDELSATGKHQGVVAFVAAASYSTVDDILSNAVNKNESPFVFILDDIEDPHNLGAIIRTANIVGAHGVVIPKNRACGITPVVAKASAGAIDHTPVARVTNLSRTIDMLKDRGLWIVCADASGELMYDIDMTGPIALVIGNEGHGVSKNIKKHCDMIAKIPMKGNIDSLNASVACGVMSYEIARQRLNTQAG